MATMPCRSIGMSDQCLWGLAAQFVPTVYSGSVFWQLWARLPAVNRLKRDILNF
jgi:hypothetical protein